jgi:hypothetical protein
MFSSRIQIAARFLAGFLVVQFCTETLTAKEPLSFNRDIRPILSDHCYQCHGPDENQRLGGVRLDLPESALEPADSGFAAIVPGRPDDSELVRRILTEDPDEMMPPPDINKKLSSAEKGLLNRWISEGAVYEQHWALIAPENLEIPPAQISSWPRNAVDNFILNRLEQETLQPSPPAEWSTLIRRLSLDLTGLPPSPEDVATFSSEMTTAETSNDADRIYEKWVNRFLDSPHYGERMAVTWLDAARFADSNGYQVDRDREMYAWRDWVIEAFNTNKPFDEFTIEQLAGDLLPDATLQQKIATGFHRNHLMNEEGGIIPEEFLNEYCADRVETTATVWLGQTFNCCRCHDHKFDPFTQADFYSLYAFFHNVAEKGVGDYGANIRRNAPPILKLPAPELEAKIKLLKDELDKAKHEIAGIESLPKEDQTAWEEQLRESSVHWASAEIISAGIGELDASINGQQASIDIPELEAGKHSIAVDVQFSKNQATALRIEYKSPAATSKDLNGAFEIQTIEVSHVDSNTAEAEPLIIWPVSVGQSLPISEVEKALDGDNKTNITVSEKSGLSLVALFDQLPIGDEPISLRVTISVELEKKTPAWRLGITTTETNAQLLVSSSIRELALKESDQRSDKEVARLAKFFHENQLQHRRLADRIEQHTKEIDQTDLQIPTTLVMEELPEPRPTFILIRGAYDKKGAQVSANTPAILPSMASDLPKNRLGLARWITDSENPLTARVTVNRFWQCLFGTGLVRTTENFGMQGELPSHPELLDWLATRFVESGWDIKAIMRLLVTSSTYRQGSRQTAALNQRDPTNRLLARGPRFRLQAEFVRDQALAASGLLVSKIGGPSVRPYHPPGLYEQIVAGSSAKTYLLGSGEELYRRSLYTYWKRSVPNPAMLVFDAPFREMCTVRRSRTNTPLQALNLMNDPTYVEAARFLAQRMIQQKEDSLTDQIQYGFQLVLARVPSSQELVVLTEAYQRMLQNYTTDIESAKELLEVGESSFDTEFNAATLAAMTTVASTILNLDETVTKE